MATRSTLHVEVVTAERELYSGEANMVSAPGTEGRLGILPRHAALLTTLSPGSLNIKLGDAEEPIFISGGFLEVSNNSVIVLADTAQLAEETDQARAEEARRRPTLLHLRRLQSRRLPHRRSLHHPGRPDPDSRLARALHPRRALCLTHSQSIHRLPRPNHQRPRDSYRTPGYSRVRRVHRS